MDPDAIPDAPASTHAEMINTAIAAAAIAGSAFPEPATAADVIEAEYAAVLEDSGIVPYGVQGWHVDGWRITAPAMLVVRQAMLLAAVAQEPTSLFYNPTIHKYTVPEPYLLVLCEYKLRMNGIDWYNEYRTVPRCTLTAAGERYLAYFASQDWGLVSQFFKVVAQDAYAWCKDRRTFLPPIPTLQATQPVRLIELYWLALNTSSSVTGLYEAPTPALLRQLRIGLGFLVPALEQTATAAINPRRQLS